MGERIRFGLHQYWRNRGKGDMSLVCVLVAVVGMVLGVEWVGRLGQGLRGWGGVKSMFVVSQHSLC